MNKIELNLTAHNIKPHKVSKWEAFWYALKYKQSKTFKRKSFKELYEGRLAGKLFVTWERCSEVEIQI